MIDFHNPSRELGLLLPLFEGRGRCGASLRKQAVAVAFCILLPALISPAHAQFDLAGKTVTLAISTPAGGGYDLYGRLVARHIGRHLPGNPLIVSQNMPGAGSLIAANW